MRGSRSLEERIQLLQSSKLEGDALVLSRHDFSEDFGRFRAPITLSLDIYRFLT